MMSRFKFTQREARDAWLEALRSGEYEQATGRLRSSDDRHCCLGVACEVFRKVEGEDKLPRQEQDDGDSKYGTEEDSNIATLPDLVTEWLGIRDSFGNFEDHIEVSYDNDDYNDDYNEYTASSLIELNDDFSYTFEQIADVLEEHSDLIFNDPTITELQD